MKADIHDDPHLREMKRRRFTRKQLAEQYLLMDKLHTNVESHTAQAVSWLERLRCELWIHLSPEHAAS